MTPLNQFADQLTGPAIIHHLADLLRDTDDDFKESELQYHKAVEALRTMLPETQAPTLDAYLEKIAESLGNPENPEKTAEAVFQFHHEMAVLSGNMLLPLLYHSFQPEMLYLWGLYGKYSGCRHLYENKLKLYRALLNRDLPEALRLTPGEYPRSLDESTYFMKA